MDRGSGYWSRVLAHTSSKLTLNPLLGTSKLWRHDSRSPGTTSLRLSARVVEDGGAVPIVGAHVYARAGCQLSISLHPIYVVLDRLRTQQSSTGNE
jgi:hypothetical protein